MIRINISNINSKNTMVKKNASKNTMVKLKNSKSKTSKKSSNIFNNNTNNTNNISKDDLFKLIEKFYPTLNSSDQDKLIETLHHLSDQKAIKNPPALLKISQSQLQQQQQQQYTTNTNTTHFNFQSQNGLNSNNNSTNSNSLFYYNSSNQQRIIQYISGRQVPDYWSIVSHNNAIYPGEDITIVNLKNTSTDYKEITTRFFETKPLHSAEITCIQRVENKWLWWKFYDKRAQIAAEIWLEKPEDQKKQTLNAAELASEYYLFHGTSSESIDKIKYQGIDFRLTNRALYGRGAYFTPSAELAHEYSKQKENNVSSLSKIMNLRQKTACMILARALLGNSIEVEDNSIMRNANRPPVSNMKNQNLYHSVNSNNNAHHIDKATQYALFDNGQIYPEYIIYYTYN